MPSRKQSALFINVRTKGFTLIEIIVVMVVFTMIVAMGIGLSLHQYNQWLAFAQRESTLDALIRDRSPTMSTSTRTLHFSIGSFTETITLYENGELQY